MSHILDEFRAISSTGGATWHVAQPCPCTYTMLPCVAYSQQISCSYVTGVWFSVLRVTHQFNFWRSGLGAPSHTSAHSTLPRPQSPHLAPALRLPPPPSAPPQPRASALAPPPPRSVVSFLGPTVHGAHAGGVLPFRSRRGRAGAAHGPATSTNYAGAYTPHRLALLAL